MKVLQRGKLTIVLYDAKIVVFDAHQATLYAPWMSPNDHLFYQMKEFLRTSEPNEYSSWVEILCLASACRVTGMGTRIPNLTDFES